MVMCFMKNSTEEGKLMIQKVLLGEWGYLIPCTAQRLVMAGRTWGQQITAMFHLLLKE